LIHLANGANQQTQRPTLSQTKTTPRRRRFRFSLRTLLMVVVLLSVPMGWFALKMRQAERQRQAVEAIQKAGGYVAYDYEFYGSGPPGPAWLRRLLCEDFFANVVLVHFSMRFGDGYMVHLKGLTGLEWLELTGTQVTDGGLEHLRGLTKLDSLELSDTQITDAGLEHLKGLTKLEDLNLSNTQVTDAGLEYLEVLRNLRILELSSTQVTDAGLENLKGLTKLKYLDLRETQVTDEGIKDLQKALPNCEIRHKAVAADPFSV
jgi:hypothetical protein